MHDSFGSFLQAVARAGQGSHEDQKRVQRSAPAGASEQVPSDGGFLIDRQFIPEIVERMYETGSILSRCWEFPLTKPNANTLQFAQFDEQSRKSGSRFGGLESYWQNEADALIPSKPKFRMSSMTAKKLTGLLYVTDELVQDAAVLDIFGKAAVAKELAFRLENAIINGTGAGEPLGILNSPALIQTPKLNGQPNGTVNATNIVNMWEQLWGPSRRYAVWLVNQQLETQLLTLSLSVGTGGSSIPLYVPTTDPVNQPYNLMLGRPVIPVEYCPVAGVPGDILFADLSRYIVAMKEALLATVSIHVRFLDDQSVFKFVMRVDGQALDHLPLIPYNGTTPMSPFTCIVQR